MLAHYLGLSDAADAFTAAIRIPNLLQNLLGEGVLSASFIPVYARLRAEGRGHEAGEVGNAVFRLLAFAAALIASGTIAVDRLISRRIGLDELPDAIANPPRPGEVKVLVMPDLQA